MAVGGPVQQVRFWPTPAGGDPSRHGLLDGGLRTLGLLNLRGGFRPRGRTSLSCDLRSLKLAARLTGINFASPVLVRNLLSKLDFEYLKFMVRQSPLYVPVTCIFPESRHPRCAQDPSTMIGHGTLIPRPRSVGSRTRSWPMVQPTCHPTSGDRGHAWTLGFLVHRTAPKRLRSMDPREVFNRNENPLKNRVCFDE